MWLQSPVFYVQWNDAWRHHYEYIYTEHEKYHWGRPGALFSRSKDDAIQLYKGSMQHFTWKTTIANTKRTQSSHNCIGIEIWRKCLNGITLIKSTQADLEKTFDEFINHKIEFNTTHIIKSYIQPVTNVPEEARFISFMTPTVFRKDQDESRCYVNSTFQVIFQYIF